MDHRVQIKRILQRITPSLIQLQIKRSPQIRLKIQLLIKHTRIQQFPTTKQLIRLRTAVAGPIRQQI